MDRGAWWGYSPQVTESGTRLSDETATPVTCESDLVYKQDLANAHGGGGSGGQMEMDAERYWCTYEPQHS